MAKEKQKTNYLVLIGGIVFLIAFLGILCYILPNINKQQEEKWEMIEKEIIRCWDEFNETTQEIPFFCSIDTPQECDIFNLQFKVAVLEREDCLDKIRYSLYKETDIKRL